MSKFSPGKLWNFGGMCKDHDEFTHLLWDEFVKKDHFKEWAEKHEINETEIEFIKQGWHGENLHAVHTASIFPFGKYKGQTFKNVPVGYLQWTLQQDWLHKWGNLELQIKEYLQEQNLNIASKEDIKNILHKI